MYRVALFWLCLLALFGSVLPAGAADIHFLPRAEIKGPDLRLGDVARISPDQAAAAWKDVVLFRIPDFGTVHEYRAKTLKAYVQRALGSDRNITWGGADHIQVSRSGEVMDRERVAHLVNDYVQRTMNRPQVISAHFEPGRMPRPFSLPTNWTCDIVPDRKDLLSARSFALVFRKKGRVLKNVTAFGRVEAKAKVAVAAKDLHRNGRLTAADISMEPKRLSRVRNPIFDPQTAVGQRVVRTVAAGSVLEHDDLAAPLLVKRNQPVTLEAVKGRLVITASGIAQEDGALKDVVRVKNARSGQEVFGRVIGADTVRVRF